MPKVHLIDDLRFFQIDNLFYTSQEDIKYLILIYWWNDICQNMPKMIYLLIIEQENSVHPI